MILYSKRSNNCNFNCRSRSVFLRKVCVFLNNAAFLETKWEIICLKENVTAEKAVKSVQYFDDWKITNTVLISRNKHICIQIIKNHFQEKCIISKVIMSQQICCELNEFLYQYLVQRARALTLVDSSTWSCKSTRCDYLYWQSLGS